MGISIAHFFRGIHPTAKDSCPACQFSSIPAIAYESLLAGVSCKCISGEYQQGESSILKAFELSPIDPFLMHFHGVLYFACLGQEKYEEALEAIDKALLTASRRRTSFRFSCSGARDTWSVVQMPRRH